jgi:hypothetical protein
MIQHYNMLQFDNYSTLLPYYYKEPSNEYPSLLICKDIIQSCMQTSMFLKISIIPICIITLYYAIAIIISIIQWNLSIKTIFNPFFLPHEEPIIFSYEKASQAIYKFYIFTHRLMMIILRIIFIPIILCTDMPIFVGYNPNLEYLQVLLYLFLFENCDAIFIILHGRKIVRKRRIYFLCCATLIMQACTGYLYFPIMFFYANHICDLIKDLALFQSLPNHKLINNLYILKTCCLLLIFIHAALKYSHKETFITILSLCDSYHRLSIAY